MDLVEQSAKGRSRGLLLGQHPAGGIQAVRLRDVQAGVIHAGAPQPAEQPPGFRAAPLEIRLADHRPAERSRTPGRRPATTGPPAGCGRGTIVAAVAAAHRASVDIGEGPSGRGLRVTLRLPVDPDPQR